MIGIQTELNFKPKWPRLFWDFGVIKKLYMYIKRSRLVKISEVLFLCSDFKQCPKSVRAGNETKAACPKTEICSSVFGRSL